MTTVDPVVNIFAGAHQQRLETHAAANIEALKVDESGPKLGKVEAKKVAQDFESMFLAQMLQSLKPEESDEDSLFNSGESDEIFRSMMMEEYAKEISKSGGIGIASYIERELLGTQGVQSTPRPVPAQWQKILDNYEHKPQVTTTEDMKL